MVSKPTPYIFFLNLEMGNAESSNPLKILDKRTVRWEYRENYVNKRF